MNRTLQIQDLSFLQPFLTHLTAENRQLVASVPGLLAEKAELENGLQTLGIALQPTQRQVYQARLAEINRDVDQLARVTEAVRRGFDPFTPNPKWFGGFVDRSQASPGTLVFSAPIPPKVLRRHEAARKTGLFDHFKVFSPNREHFTQIAPLRIDPVLVGYIGSQCFLIAHWDLTRDLGNIQTANS